MRWSLNIQIPGRDELVVLLHQTDGADLAGRHAQAAPEGKRGQIYFFDYEY